MDYGQKTAVAPIINGMVLHALQSRFSNLSSSMYMLTITLVAV
jgi:hypothetical protein